MVAHEEIVSSAWGGGGGVLCGLSTQFKGVDFFWGGVGVRIQFSYDYLSLASDL